MCVFSCKERKLPCLESESDCPQRVTGCRGCAACLCAFRWLRSLAQEQSKCVLLALVAEEV